MPAKDAFPYANSGGASHKTAQHVFFWGGRGGSRIWLGSVIVYQMERRLGYDHISYISLEKSSQMIQKSIHEILGSLKSLRSPRLHHGDRDAPLRIAWAWGLVPCITPQKRTAGTWKYRRKERERHLQYKPSQTLGLMLVFKLYNLFFYTSGDDAPGITDASRLRFRSTNLGTAGCGLRATLLSAPGPKDGKEMTWKWEKVTPSNFSSNFVWNLGWNDDFIKMEICFWLMNWEMIWVARWSVNPLITRALY